jgi:hypothetical protein
MADPDDANSWEQGKQIVDETVAGIKAASPYWAESPVTIEANRAGNIQITALTGERITITREQLGLIYQARKRAAAEQDMAEKVDKAQRNQGLYKDFIRGGKGPL